MNMKQIRKDILNSNDNKLIELLNLNDKDLKRLIYLFKNIYIK